MFGDQRSISLMLQPAIRILAARREEIAVERAAIAKRLAKIDFDLRVYDVAEKAILSNKTEDI